MHEDLGDFYAAIADVSPDPECIPYGACEPLGMGHKIPLRHYKEVEAEQIAEFRQLKRGEEAVKVLFPNHDEPPKPKAKILQFTGLWRGDDSPQPLQGCTDNTTELDCNMVNLPPIYLSFVPGTPTPEGIQSLLTLIETVKCDPDILTALHISPEDMEAAEELIRQNWERPTPKSPWIPLQERTPARGEKVIGYDAIADDANTVYYTHEGFESWLSGRCIKFTSITHWLPIPDTSAIKVKPHQSPHSPPHPDHDH
jgi:hypothetical protein